MEVNDLQKEFQPALEMPNVEVLTANVQELAKEWADYFGALEDYAREEWGEQFYEECLKENFDEFWNSYEELDKTLDSCKSPVADVKKNGEVIEAREWGVKEGADVASRCFTPEVIREWGSMSLEERNVVLQEYAKGIGEALQIDFKGIIWKEFPDENGMHTYGSNAGDGWLHLNIESLANPADLMRMVDTIAHEARHQFQFEAMLNPEKYPIDQDTIKEWLIGNSVYTTELPTAYDPWGYTYNSTEIDARYYGETMVRELTKAIVNNA